MFKEQKGITLIALVITIIVLLILAGVSIAMLSGDNGILTKAGDAKTNTSESQAAELVNFKLNEIMTDILAGDADIEKTYSSVSVTSGTKTLATITTTKETTTGDYIVTVTGDSTNWPTDLDVSNVGIKKTDGKYVLTGVSYTPGK